MKLFNFFLVILIIASIFISMYSVGATTWDESKNLSEADYGQTRPQIDVSGDTIHVVWEDNAKGLIQYRRSIDGGDTWEPVINLIDSDGDAIQQDPDIAAYGENVYVVWEDQRNSATSGSDIYLKQSEDSGITWKAEEQLTINEANQWNPRIVAFDEYVHLTWLDERNMVASNYDIYYRRSTTSGQTWDNEQRLTSDSSIQWKQSIAAYADNVYVVYEDYREWHYPPGGSKGIIVYFASSTNGGESWSTGNRLPTEGTWQMYPDVVASENYVYITWTDFRGFFESWLDIWLIVSADNGETWFNDTMISTDSKLQDYPRISAVGKQFHIMWQDYRNANTTGIDIYYRKGSVNVDNKIDLETPVRLTESGWQYDQAIATSNNGMHIVWTEEKLMEAKGQEIFYKRHTD
jgi:hypothetical protein